MPSGDGNRIWFPEMIEMLRSQWNESTTFPYCWAEFASRFSLPEVRQNRQNRKFCPYRISVRAAILALGRFGIASPELTKKLERDWAQYRSQKRLDLYGRPAEGQPAEDENSHLGCAHSVQR